MFSGFFDFTFGGIDLELEFSNFCHRNKVLKMQKTAYTFILRCHNFNLYDSTDMNTSNMGGDLALCLTFIDGRRGEGNQE